MHREVREPERGEPGYECGEAPKSKGKPRLMGSGQNRLQLRGAEVPEGRALRI